MAKARHRLTGLRDTTISGDEGAGVYTISANPDEDTYILDVTAHIDGTVGAGGTGSTSGTYLASQNIAKNLDIPRDNGVIKVGAVFRDGFTHEFNPDDAALGLTGWIATPAKRGLIHFDFNNWGKDPAGGGESFGITTGDTILSAHLILHKHSVLGHDNNAQGDHNPAAPYFKTRDVTIYKSLRGFTTPYTGASTGITVGSLANTDWWAYKGGDTLSSYWGKSGGSSLGTGDSCDITGPSVIFTQGHGYNWIGNDGFKTHSIAETIDVKDMVQDATDNFKNRLTMVLVGGSDTDGRTEDAPNDFTANDFWYPSWAAETWYYSRDWDDPNKWPQIVIRFKRG